MTSIIIANKFCIIFLKIKFHQLVDLLPILWAWQDAFYRSCAGFHTLEFSARQWIIRLARRSYHTGAYRPKHLHTVHVSKKQFKSCCVHFCVPLITNHVITSFRPKWSIRTGWTESMGQSHILSCLVHWDGMDRRDNAIMFGTFPWCTISSCLVHWDRMDKMDNAVVFGTVPWCTISSCMVHWDEMSNLDSASVWDSPMVYHPVWWYSGMGWCWGVATEWDYMCTNVLMDSLRQYWTSMATHSF